MNTHEEIRELLGAYALDAVDADERRALEHHLTTCDACTREVSEHCEVVAGLAPDVDVAPSLWEGIERSMSPRPEEEASRRPRRRVAAALSAAAVAALAFLGWKVMDLDARLDRAGGEGVVAAANAALTNPEADRLVLRSPKSTLAVDVVILPDGTGYLVQDNLDPLPEGRTYQLWAMLGEQPISAGTLGRDPGIIPFRVGSGTTGLAVSVERAGGATAPTSDPVAFGTVTLR